MLCPYRILLRQGASGSRKREQVPALHRIATRLRLECGGLPPLSWELQELKPFSSDLFMSPAKGPPTNNIQMVRSGRRFIGRFRRVLPRIFGGAASSAPTGYCYGKAGPGVESGSELPHSTESRRGGVWSTAKATTRGNGTAKGRRCAPVFFVGAKAPTR
jgi:hypothetical protein